jgi:hypothetical protein
MAPGAGRREILRLRSPAAPVRPFQTMPYRARKLPLNLTLCAKPHKDRSYSPGGQAGNSLKLLAPREEQR